jgi:hypothetical protein
MAAWLVPALKAVLPHIGSIISAARPVFTGKTEASTQALVQEQIAELQAAASQNSAHIKALAEELQATVAALEQAALIAESRLRRALALCAVAAVFAAAALGLAVYLLIAR